jgi:hypothetical protein
MFEQNKKSPKKNFLISVTDNIKTPSNLVNLLIDEKFII